MGELNIKNLKFSFDKSKSLIACPSFCFEPGNIYALVGPNGSGKTTFLKILLGLLKPTEGEVYGAERETIGFVPDYNGLYDSLSVLENIKFRLSLYKMNYKNEKEKIQQMLTSYNLDGEAKRTRWRVTKRAAEQNSRKSSKMVACGCLILKSMVMGARPLTASFLRFPQCGHPSSERSCHSVRQSKGRA